MKPCHDGQGLKLCLGQLDSLGRLCRHCAQPVTICGRGASQIYLVSNLLQRSLQMIQPSDPEPKIKTPIRVFEFLGWGNWIRTNTSGVRVRCSTIKLCPKVPWIIYPRFSFCNLFFMRLSRNCPMWCIRSYGLNMAYLDTIQT